MPSYYYHLKFELYPSPNPTQTASCNADVWLPSKDFDIFDQLPSHSRKNILHEIPSPKFNSSPRSRAPATSATSGSSLPNVIDCGNSRATAQESSGSSNIVVISERQWRQRSESFPPPHSSAAIGPQQAVRDWRFGALSIESVDLLATASRSIDDQNMVGTPAQASSSAAASAVGPNVGAAGKATKAKFIPIETRNTEVGWGIVHLYREGEETPALAQAERVEDELDDTHCTTLCIPAVPSYLNASDFLGFVGDQWKEDVTHYRMVMTPRMNRYLVLMKFRNGKKARAWRREFDGKVFNSMESETCHVVCIKSISFETPTRPDGSFPDLSHDPFIPNSLKPFPPPTPNLIELPTCPVCLERMDDTTGLMTIPCQHVFHCSCLQKWKGSGCPVCRHTNPSILSSDGYYSHPGSPTTMDPSNPCSQPFGQHISNLCSVCDCADDLWICLICGNVGCGRYKGGHAKEHWKETAHCFALELETQHVWDYAEDLWVHRLIRDKGDGKVLELPHRGGDGGENRGNTEDTVPRAKLEAIGLEYTHLLSSQLDSQRVYFEEMLSKAADKAAQAAAAAEKAAIQADEARKELRILRADHDRLAKETVPQLERDIERERKRADKASELARNLGKALQEEKKVSEGLMERVKHVNAQTEALKTEVEATKKENSELQEMNRDLTMFISGQEKLKEMEEEGQIQGEELREGTASAPIPEERRRRRRGRGG